MTTVQLRETFLIEDLYEPGALQLAYIDLDRAVVGLAAPLASPVELPADPLLRVDYFTERRELGALNIGGSGTIHVDGKAYVLANLDCLYIGRGSKRVSFESANSKSPAVFYLLSYPAHASYPTTLIRKEDANPVELGSAETCNHRTIYKYIHGEGARSCNWSWGSRICFRAARGTPCRRIRTCAARKSMHTSTSQTPRESST